MPLTMGGIGTSQPPQEQPPWSSPTPRGPILTSAGKYYGASGMAGPIGLGGPGGPGTRPGFPGTTGAPPWAQGGGGGGAGGAYNSSTEANPYLRQAFEAYQKLLAQAQELYNKAPDQQGAIENFERTRSQGLKELQAMSGQRGFGPGTGMSIAQMQNYGQDTMQGEQGLSTQLYNQGIQHQKDILGQLGQLALGMTGAGGSIASNQLGNRAQGLAESQFGYDSWLKSQLLPYQMQNLASSNRAAEISALANLAALA